jgi:hypothetical protein
MSVSRSCTETCTKSCTETSCFSVVSRHENQFFLPGKTDFHGLTKMLTGILKMFYTAPCRKRCGAGTSAGICAGKGGLKDS